MESKIMQVFYGTDCLPYKDKARSVHYPIIGQAFEGASATTEIRFYVRDIGGVDTTKWIANTKLPSGKKGYKLLDSAYDSVVQERYVVLTLDQFYTQEKGDVYISLNGYDGGITLEQDENDNYILEGTPIIQATGSIKITMQYAVQINQSDIQEYIDLDDILAYITGKADVSFVKSNFIPKLYVDREHDDYYEKPIKDYITPLVANGFNLNVNGSPLIIGLELIDSGEGTGETYIISFISKGDGANADIQLFRVSDKLYATFTNFTLNEVFETLIVGITSSNSSHLSTDIDIARLEGLIGANADDILYLQNNKQDTLVSGQNIKTVNNLTLLGSGNIEIEGTQITIDSQLSTTSTNPVQNRVITNEMQNVLEIAEGKTTSFSVDTRTSGNSAFQSDDDTITATSFVDVEGNTINVSELNKGDLVFTINVEGHKYKDRWLINPATGSWGLIDADTPDMENYATITYVDDELAEKTDLDIIAPNYSNLRGYVVGDKVIYEGQLYTCNTAITTAEDFNSSHWTAIKVSNGFVDLDSSQEISGAKTHTANITLKNNVSLKLGNSYSNGYSLSNDGSGGLNFKNNYNVVKYNMIDGSFSSPSNSDLGTSTYKWKDLYLSGTSNLSDGTNTWTWGLDGSNMTLSYNSTRKIEIGTSACWGSTDNNYSLGLSNRRFKDLYLSGTAFIETIQHSTSMTLKGVNALNINGFSVLRPSTNNYCDLGQSSLAWKDGYFSGQVYAQNTLNVINASDITNNTLTQAQYDLITNGKPTLIVGATPNDNYWLLTYHDYTSYIHILSFYRNSFSNIEIIKATLHINWNYGNETNGIGITDGKTTIRKLTDVNGKAIPNYPSNAGTFNFQCVNGTLAWNEQWYGTQAEYDALGTYDSNTIYNILES